MWTYVPNLQIFFRYLIVPILLNIYMLKYIILKGSKINNYKYYFIMCF